MGLPMGLGLGLGLGLGPGGREEGVVVVVEIVGGATKLGASI